MAVAILFRSTRPGAKCAPTRWFFLPKLAHSPRRALTHAVCGLWQVNIDDHLGPAAFSWGRHSKALHTSPAEGACPATDRPMHGAQPKHTFFAGVPKWIGASVTCVMSMRDQSALLP